MLNEKELIQKIHTLPQKAVIAVTGGGSDSIGELLRYGGGSNTILEFSVPYAQKSFDRFIKGTPDKYCSPEAACDLAMAAFQRAINLTSTDDIPNLIGIGATCSLAKDNERDGREHWAHIAIQTKDNSEVLSYRLDAWKDAPYSKPTRQEEEELVSKIIIYALAKGHGIEYVENPHPNWPVVNLNTLFYNDRILNFQTFSREQKTADENLSKLLTGQSLFLDEKLDRERKIIFAGSFNPFHAGHEEMARVVANLTGQKIDLEICVHNVDKPAINYISFDKRKQNLEKAVENFPWYGQTHYTALSTFKQKAEQFPEARFIVGWDTFARISDPKYADMVAVIDSFKKNNSRFIVFPRIVNGKLIHEENQYNIDLDIANISDFITDFNPIEISSSEIRRAANN